MRLRQIEVFNAVMLTGSVSGAAKLMHVTQPAVTQVLQHAELQLGFPLFTRVKGRLQPTREALALYPAVEKLYRELESVRHLASNLRSGEDARLRIIAVPALAQEVIPEAVKLFVKDHPAAQISIVTLHSSQTAAALVLREADVGFVFGSNSHPALQTTEVFQAELLWAVPKGYVRNAVRGRSALERNLVARIEKVADSPFIRLDSNDPLGLVLNESLRNAGLQPQSTITVQTYLSALGLVKRGLGTAVIDPFTALSGEIARVDLHRIEPKMHLSVFALQAAQEHTSTTVESFISCTRKAMERLLPRVYERFD